MKMAFPYCAADRSLLPMEVQVGDRFTEGGFDWEVRKRPAVMHGAKTLRARVVRPGLPETEREVTWIAHERVTIRLAEAVIVHGQFRVPRDTAGLVLCKTTGKSLPQE
jgi:hypothetical protein